MSKVASVEKLPQVAWKNVRVVTTEVLAQLYGTSETNIHDNYRKNSERFVEGKHFFKLEGEDLKEFKKSLTGKFPVSRIRHLTLWTERGAARHAKMLETDKAWEVFEKLEDCYFRKVEATTTDEPEEDLSTLNDREPLLAAAVTLVVRHRLPFNVVYETMNHFAGAERFKVMTKKQVKEVAKFVGRFLTGNDTRQDWLRIEKNRRAIAGDSNQPELTGFMVPGVFGGK